MIALGWGRAREKGNDRWRGQGFCRVMKCSIVRLNGDCVALTMLQNAELCILNGRILWHMIKAVFSKTKQNKTEKASN